jgi:hypothetical protein
MLLPNRHESLERNNMNRTLTRFIIFTFFCVTISLPILASDSGITAGEFLVKIADARNLDAVDGASAMKLLRFSGVDLPDIDMTGALTEGTVAAISSSLGIPVSTSRPLEEFKRRAVKAYMDQFKAAVNPFRNTAVDPGPYPRPNDTAADPRAKGKGKKKGLPPVSESAPL